jgi:hypothetical protein
LYGDATTIRREPIDELLKEYLYRKCGRHYGRLSKIILPSGVLKTLSCQIIDYSYFAAQHDLALDDEAKDDPYRHQLRH